MAWGMARAIRQKGVDRVKGERRRKIEKEKKSWVVGYGFEGGGLMLTRMYDVQ
jgi:hypothetical protein